MLCSPLELHIYTRYSTSIVRRIVPSNCFCESCNKCCMRQLGLSYSVAEVHFFRFLGGGQSLVNFQQFWLLSNQLWLWYKTGKKYDFFSYFGKLNDFFHLHHNSKYFRQMLNISNKLDVRGGGWGQPLPTSSHPIPTSSHPILTSIPVSTTCISTKSPQLHSFEFYSVSLVVPVFCHFSIEFMRMKSRLYIYIYTCINDALW